MRRALLEVNKQGLLVGDPELVGRDPPHRAKPGHEVDIRVFDGKRGKRSAMVVSQQLGRLP
jgi:hypothetical protein